jgi:hypothetical protein
VPSLCIRRLPFTEENCNNDMPNNAASIPIVIIGLISEKFISFSNNTIPNQFLDDDDDNDNEEEEDDSNNDIKVT